MSQLYAAICQENHFFFCVLGYSSVIFKKPDGLETIFNHYGPGGKTFSGLIQALIGVRSNGDRETFIFRKTVRFTNNIVIQVEGPEGGIITLQNTDYGQTVQAEKMNGNSDSSALLSAGGSATPPSVRSVPRSVGTAAEILRDVQATLPRGWECRFNFDGRLYYVNHDARSTSWDPPDPEFGVNVLSRSQNRAIGSSGSGIPRARSPYAIPRLPGWNQGEPPTDRDPFLEDVPSTIRPVNNRSVEYKDIKNLFIDSWLHPNKSKPSVTGVFSVTVPARVMARYDAYRRRMTSELGALKLNEQLLFHGTRRTCHIGDPGEALERCELPDCNLCSIFLNSLDKNHSNPRGISFLRFGQGVYVTSVSSKADDYTSCSTGSRSTYKALLVVKAILGKGWPLTRDDTSLISPPAGYHSVLGETGFSLNFEEQVLYRNDAIRPAYLIVYKA